MDIPAIPAGLAGTAQAIQRAQARFAASSQQVTSDAQSLADPAVSADVANLPRDIATMQADAISNRILFAVSQRQQEMQGDLANLGATTG